eukprot:4446892-Pleurochrysis_carterae.AAC.1
MECWRSLPVAAQGPLPARQGRTYSCIGRLPSDSVKRAKKTKDWRTIRLVCAIRCISLIIRPATRP